MVRHLPHAPIVEALIDIQVNPRDGILLRDIEEAFGSPDFGYYLKAPILEQSFAFSLGVDGQSLPSTGSPATVGLRLHSQDEKYVLQVRPERMTLSRLPPYENWGNLEAETRRLWSIFAQRLFPDAVVRVAARYINNLRLPMRPGESFQKYLNKLVDVPDGSPQAVETFVQRFQLFDQGNDARVVLTISMNGLDLDGVAPVVLDVDAFKVVHIEPLDPSLWNELEMIKGLKNKSFFGALTDTALELYK